MNYAGERRSVLTLAHELGHGLHGALAQDLGLLNARTPLTLAETASVFGEALTFETLMEREDDPARPARPARRPDRRHDRDRLPPDRAQPLRARDPHRPARGGRAAGRADLRALEREQERMLGDAVEVTDDYGIWWSYVPHFIQAPGYVYAYSFGYLFSLAIYRRYLDEGESLVEPYLDLLRAGGSAPPAELASRLGFDIGDPGFWSAGLDAIGVLVDEAEQLAAAARRLGAPRRRRDRAGARARRGSADGALRDRARRGGGGDGAGARRGAAERRPPRRHRRRPRARAAHARARLGGGLLRRRRAARARARAARRRPARAAARGLPGCRRCARSGRARASAARTRSTSRRWRASPCSARASSPACPAVEVRVVSNEIDEPRSRALALRRRVRAARRDARRGWSL